MFPDVLSFRHIQGVGEARLTVKTRDVLDEDLHRLLFARVRADARDAGAAVHGGGCGCGFVC